MKIIPRFILETTIEGPNGTTIQPIKLKKNVIKGAKINKNLFARIGNTISFVKSLTASAIACNNPKTPTLLGPKRCWIAPNNFRSYNVKNATVIKRQIIIDKNKIKL